MDLIEYRIPCLGNVWELSLDVPYEYHNFGNIGITIMVNFISMHAHIPTGKVKKCG